MRRYPQIFVIHDKTGDISQREDLMRQLLGKAASIATKKEIA